MEKTKLFILKLSLVLAPFVVTAQEGISKQVKDSLINKEIPFNQPIQKDPTDTVESDYKNLSPDFKKHIENHRKEFWKNPVTINLTQNDLNFLSTIDGLKLNLKGKNNTTDVSSLTNLVKLTIQGTASPTDISKLKNLTFLSTNDITTGDITSLIKLERLFCNSPKIKGNINKLLNINLLSINKGDSQLWGDINSLWAEQKRIYEEAADNANKSIEGREIYIKNKPYSRLEEVFFSGGFELSPTPPKDTD